MIRHDHWGPYEFMNSAAQTTQRLIGVQERLGREASKRADGLRCDQLELSTKIRPAACNFIWPGIPVLRRTTLEHVADENLSPQEAHRQKHLVQELPRRPNEWAAGSVLRVPRRLADDEQIRVRITLTEDHAGPPLRETAEGAGENFVAQRLELGASGARRRPRPRPRPRPRRWRSARIRRGAQRPSVRGGGGGGEAWRARPQKLEGTFCRQSLQEPIAFAELRSLFEKADQ